VLDQCGVQTVLYSSSLLLEQCDVRNVSC